MKKKTKDESTTRVFLYSVVFILSAGLLLMAAFAVREQRVAETFVAAHASCIENNKVLYDEAINSIKGEARSVAVCETQKLVLAEQVRVLSTNQSQCPVTVVVIGEVKDIESADIKYTDAPKGGAA